MTKDAVQEAIEESIRDLRIKVKIDNDYGKVYVKVELETEGLKVISSDQDSFYLPNSDTTY